MQKLISQISLLNIQQIINQHYSQFITYSFRILINYHLFFKSFSMKNRKSKKKSEHTSPYNKLNAISQRRSLAIKFNITKANISCFIGEKNQNKKSALKASKSLKNRKPSVKKNQIPNIKEQSTKNQTQILRRTQQSPDIIRDSSNSILKQIENKGIKCNWLQPQQNNTQKEAENQNIDDSQIWSVYSVNSSVQKSYASTIDYQPMTYYTSANFHPTIAYSQGYCYQYKIRSQSFENNGFEVVLDNIGYDPRTTIMIRNIPNKYTIRDLSEQIDNYLENTYDFLYLPCDLKNQCNVGYGFINFINTEYLREFYLAFHNHRWSKFRSQKICILSYARLQGLNNLIEHFQNSKVLNQKDKKYRPIIRKNEKIQNLIKFQQEK